MEGGVEVVFLQKILIRVLNGIETLFLSTIVDGFRTVSDPF